MLYNGENIDEFYDFWVSYAALGNGLAGVYKKRAISKDIFVNFAEPDGLLTFATKTSTKVGGWHNPYGPAWIKRRKKGELSSTVSLRCIKGVVFEYLVFFDMEGFAVTKEEWEKHPLVREAFFTKILKDVFDGDI